MILDLGYKEIELAKGASIQARPLEVGDYQRLTRAVANTAKKMVEVEKIEQGLEQLSDEKLVEMGSQIIPKYCTNLKGIEINENGALRQAVIDDLLKYGAFIPQIITIIMKLFEISTLKQEEESELKK